MKVVRIERELAGRKLVLETGRLAKQADAAVLVTFGETVILACVQSAAPREGLDFFPLTVDYREKTYAAGKFPGGFFKREARPTDKETLTSRLIDRPLRPLFPDGYKDDVQVMVTVLSYDGQNDPDIAAMIGTFAAVNISTIPFEGPMGACRVGLVDDHFVINPTAAECQKSELELVIAATKDAITMVEAGAKELDEETMLEALETGHEACREICAIIAELVKKAGKKKMVFTPAPVDEKLHAAIEKKYYRKIMDAVTSEGSKQERKEAVSAVKDEIAEFYAKSFAKLSSEDAAKSLKAVKAHVYALTSRAERESILNGKRTDGRGLGDIRAITCSVGELPRAHGSAVFTRGETQALVVATLGTKDDEQIVDGLGDEARRRFLLHYNFPPFSVGETKPIRGPGRREIGHGALALRGLESVLPTAEEFPYTIRLVSEILESNGSSSMATVCGGTLALMDAGVPIRQPVAGIAMGLVKEGRKTAILSDIHGSEDHCGDMDFKVTGTQNGITALQMDIKCKGLTRALLEQALEQARVGRVHILKEMLTSLRRPRESLSAYAPRLVRIKIDPEKIGMIIGPGGKHIRSLQEETKTRINVDDTGVVIVAGLDAKGVDHAVRTIEAMTADVEVGRVYKGKVVSIKEFGAFVEILPGQEGLCHVSELSDEFIRSVTEVVQVGDEIEVKVLDVDPLGKIKLSRKAVLAGGAAEVGERGERAPRPDRGPRPERGERRERGERPERGPRHERGARDDASHDDERPRRRSREDRDVRHRDERPVPVRDVVDHDEVDRDYVDRDVVDGDAAIVEDRYEGQGRRDRDARGRGERLRDEPRRGGPRSRDAFDDEAPRAAIPARKHHVDEAPRYRGERDRDRGERDRDRGERGRDRGELGRGDRDRGERDRGDRDRGERDRGELGRGERDRGDRGRDRGERDRDRGERDRDRGERARGPRDFVEGEPSRRRGRDDFEDDRDLAPARRPEGRGRDRVVRDDDAPSRPARTERYARDEPVEAPRAPRRDAQPDPDFDELPPRVAPARGADPRREGGRRPRRSRDEAAVREVPRVAIHDDDDFEAEAPPPARRPRAAKAAVDEVSPVPPARARRGRATEDSAPVERDADEARPRRARRVERSPRDGDAGADVVEDAPRPRRRRTRSPS